MAVAEGDWLRRIDNDWEGQVVAVNGNDITLRMNIGGEQVVTAEQVEYNTWDPKYPLHKESQA